MGFRRGGVGYVLVKTDTILEDSVGDGRPILVDGSYDRAKVVRTYATVVQTPVSMGNYPIRQIPVGFPGYGAIRIYKDHDMDNPHPALYRIGGVNKYRFMSDIAEEVMVGDRIYFKWRVMYGRNNILARSEGDNPEYLVKVPYDHIYCAVRGGEIIPIGGHVLIQPEREDEREIMIKTYYDVKDRNGNPVERPESQWIRTKIFPDNKDRVGTVFRTGTPLRGDGRYLENGIRVVYKTRLKSLLLVEGHRYFIIPQNNILAKIL